MERLFKCAYTGKIFNSELDCIESEYKNGNERQKFIDLVNKFLDEIKNKYEVIIYPESINIYDQKENYIDDRIVHWRHVKFDFELEGEKREYRRFSDSVGDGRWEWYIKDNVESFVLDFEREFILPRMKEFSGILSRNYWNNYESYLKLENRNLDDILSVLEGKKINIQIIE